MRNRAPRSGVYGIVNRPMLLLLCSLSLPAQTSPRLEPLDAEIQAVWQVRGARHFAEADARREQARALLERAPADSPRLGGWAQQVAMLYQSSGMRVRERAILTATLARTAALAESHPSRIALLSALAESWHQDGNLLKAAALFEQAAAAQPATPASPPPPDQARFIAISGRHARVAYAWGFQSGLDASMRLAGLYQELGRPEALAALAARVRAIAANNDSILAQFYEQQGALDQASATYKKIAGKSTDPKAQMDAWQSVARLEAEQERFEGAVDATQRAIAASASSDRQPPLDQALRSMLGEYLRRAGQIDQADQLYRQMVEQDRGGPQELQGLAMYANHLGETRRAVEGEALLKEYLETHPNPEPGDKTSLLFHLANLSRLRGDPASAAEYEKSAQASLQDQQSAQPGAQRTRAADELQRATQAAQANRLDDAYHAILSAIDEAPGDADGEQVVWQAPWIASMLASNKQEARADELFRKLFDLAQTWSSHNFQVLVSLAQNYARYTMGRPGRAEDANAAIERYRNLVIEANGPESGAVAEPLRMRIELAQSHADHAQAEAAARELLELQQSLSGDTSEPYFNDLELASRVFQGAGDDARALPLLRKAVAIADLLSARGGEWRRVQSRMNLALVLARIDRFDEAESIGEEALVLQRQLRVEGPPLDQQLEQIRRMGANRRRPQ